MTVHQKGSGTSWVGRSLRRVEDPALVTGQGRFTADLPAVHWVRFVRSPVAAGTIENIAAPDGATVITAADLVALKPIRPMLSKFAYVPVGQPILADGVVRFTGEPIVAVYASAKDLAEDIADQIEVEISETPALVDGMDALADGAPLVHAEAAGNVIVEGRITTPGFTEVWNSAHTIVRVDGRSRRQNATPMEARAGHAAYDAATGRVTLTCTTQMPHMVRTAISDILGMPESDLRVIAPDVGGGFGQKMSLGPEFVLLVWLSRKLRSSVAWTEDRRENLIASYHSRDQHIDIEGAFDATGKLLALRGDIVANIGAYSCFPTTSGVEPLMALAELPGPYNVQAYDCRSRGVLTHTCPMAPYRGVSRPVITFALERLMDKAAAKFCIEPTELRRRNLIDEFPYTSATGLVFDDGSYRATMEMAIAAIDLTAFRERQKKARDAGRYLGIGFATFSERTGYGTPAFAARGMAISPGFETVHLTIDPSGFIEARIGSSPHGQGLRTSLAQIIADELGVDPAIIKVVHGDTDRSPYGWGTFASRSMVLTGGASLIAAQKIRAKLIKMASHLLEASPEDITLHSGAAHVIGTDRTITIAALSRAAYHSLQVFNGTIEPGMTETGTYDPSGTFSNACHVAIVEVDIETGRVEVQKFLVAEDAGLIINPMIADGQVHGGVAQGIGNAILEEIIYDETGNIMSSTLADFLPPTSHEIPEIELHHIETLTGNTITRAKGLGEGGAIGAPAAVISAINDALSSFGVSIDEMPATPQRIRAALRSSGKST
ncbi:xanthine dehydrogenase family protein molybdopterin-binding subunit [Tardiphaga sp. vice352]|uniref:xanthine dehydrogenase family protein molybdopterin-binding subunit n=1 Tax=unclassified Tardiphaga TaxID=2631404 RepID=UPI001164BB00|nr:MULTISPECIES: xanthine dehydrogenase family protein molybdopterin-binding subunit [unclassified Tardiphaga]MBC7583244.1 xanthine dehydrogenase family protein molybdopterin-binding subunit [Tardiphaga sp.]QDM16649.1 xanthine dehydrogenase family protein molybdopterin-binding subunit [Tardiphaga sp. vice278]QDM21672.1 xanthine dehydrogenase family protein molybdopterin-binding subunit [Tardiphaga sp. vice154]QDM26857.1 xanthine dehydrogenase family protein molybdopterin-binding subunit [Tardip